MEKEEFFKEEEEEVVSIPTEEEIEQYDMMTMAETGDENPEEAEEETEEEEEISVSLLAEGEEEDLEKYDLTKNRRKK